VESVITATQEQITPASPLLSGTEGGWTSGFVILQDRVVVVLETRLLTALGSARSHITSASTENVAQKLDEDLKKLIELAPRRVEADSHQLIPQMEAAISHTEEEMAKVVDGDPRAVGSACGANPIPIIVPCHRVMAAGGTMGGYSGRGGLQTKSKLLALEGALLL